MACDVDVQHNALLKVLASDLPGSSSSCGIRATKSELNFHVLQIQPGIAGRNTRPRFSNNFPDMHNQFTNSNSTQTGHIQNTRPRTDSLKATKSDVLEITSSYRKRSANQQLDSHVFQMQTQLAGWNVRPQFLSNFLDTGIATSVGIMQSLHNQSTDSIFLHTEDRLLQVELLLLVVALVAQIQLLVTVVKAPVLFIMKTSSTMESNLECSKQESYRKRHKLGNS
ncbi:hypothetical protein Tco_0780700 [Tanacetum coccineum]